MFSYLIMMSLRLIEMKRLLKETGSIYLHCDPTASHYLKMVMDAIFGPENFRNEIIWCYSTSGRPKNRFARKHDVILFYSKTKNYRCNSKIPVSEKYLASHYRQVDDKGRQCRIRVDAGKTRIYYPSEGMICNDWWEIPYLNSQAKDRSGYPTQKPLPLLERIIQASSNKGDIVFDPFCGCATALVGAEKLGREWVGIDVSQQAAVEIKERMIKLAVDRGENELAIWKNIPPTRDLREANQLARFHRDEWGKLPHPRTHKKWLYGEQSGNCKGCGNHFESRNLEVDHYVPKSKGGTDHRSNLQLLCPGCNRKKGDRPQAYLDEQLKKLGITLH